MKFFGIFFGFSDGARPT